MDFQTIKNEILKSPDGEKLLQTAFTHRSYASENHLDYDNQRLEFLGDAVLELIASTYLFEKYPKHQEGALTAIRASMVREETLAMLARKLHLGGMLRAGKGERELQGHKRDSTLADLFEAMLGACHLACGYETTKKLLIEIFEENIPDPASSFKQLNPKGKLQEITQKHFHATPIYRVIRIKGPSHNPHYDVEVAVGQYVSPGEGPGKRDAESDAASKLYTFLAKHFGEKLK